MFKSLQKECDVLIDCKRLLRLLGNQGKLHFVRINVSPTVIGTGRTRRYIPNPDMVGMPDIIIWLKDGPFLCVELKRPGVGKLSQGQMNLKSRLENLGHQYHVVTSLKELECLLASFGCRL